MARRDALCAAGPPCRRAARRFRTARRSAAADVARIARRGGCGGGRSARGRLEARRARLGLAAEPGRAGRRVSRLLAPGLCLQPVIAPELHGRRDRRAADPHPGGGIVRAARLRRRRAHRRHFRRGRGAGRLAARSIRWSRRHGGRGDRSRPARHRRRATSGRRRNPDKITYLAFTSGTTGTPKGVMHSDNTLLANAREMVEDWGHDHAPCCSASAR